MPYSPESVLHTLKEGKFAPVYFLQGNEPYYIDQISEFLEQHAIPASERSFNQVVLYGKDVTMQDIMSNARRFPMMAEKQLVIVKEAQEMSDFNSESSVKTLENYLQQPLASTILVFCYKYKTLDNRKSIAKIINDRSILVTTKKIYDNQLPEWISAYLSGKGFEISPKACYMIAEFVGNNLERISNEIEKMLINFKDKSVINEEEVEKYIGVSKEYNVFELQKAIISRDVLKANQIINFFSASPKQNPVIPVIALLFTFFSKLLIAYQARNKSDRDLAGVLKVNPYFIKDYRLALNNFQINQIVNSINHLKIADLHSKGIQIGTVNEGQILKELIFKLLH